MMQRLFTSALLAVAMTASLSAKPSAPREVGEEASIAFPGSGGIRNFRADNDRGIWIEDSRRNWYYASFFGPCNGIRHVTSIAVDTRGSFRFDRHSAVLAGNERCTIDRLLTADRPLPEKEQRRLIEEERKKLTDEEIG